MLPAPFLLHHVVDMTGPKAKERGRQVSADLAWAHGNGSFDFSLGGGYQVVMLGEHFGTPSADSLKVGDGTRVGAVECSEPALWVAHGVANGHASSLSGAVPATAPT